MASWCPLWPLHFVVMYAVLLLAAHGVVAKVADKLTPSAASAEAIALLLQRKQPDVPDDALPLAPGSPPGFRVTYSWPDPKEAETLGELLLVHMDENKLVQFNLTGVNPHVDQVFLDSDDEDVALTGPIEWQGRAPPYTGVFNVTGVFLGKTAVRFRHRGTQVTSNPLAVTVIRNKGVLYHVFTGSVVILVAIIFVNFGCALDWQIVKETVRRPVGPVIGFTSQYVIMPVVSFGLAKLLFPDSPALQLGMFFTGVSPGGGASNVWTTILGGNLNLSITMTTISTLAAFGMMPLWIFTLGRQIFAEGNIQVPYRNISELAAALVVPVFIGWLIQRYAPRVSAFMVRILKPFSALLIIFIVIFAIVTNLYIFRLFTWEIVVAGLGLPWIGYMCGLTLAAIFRQKKEDMLAISIETGVHNTGISIVMLAVLGQPEADITTVIPVSIACMTPIPLTLFYVVKLLRERFAKRKRGTSTEDINESPVTSQTSEPPAVLVSKSPDHEKY